MKKKIQWSLARKSVGLLVVVFFSCNGTVDLGNSVAINPVTRSVIQNSSGLPYIYEAIDTLFGKFVTPDRGLVDYYGIHEDSLFIDLKDTIARFDVASILNREDSLAFYINAYNVLVIYHSKKFEFKSQEPAFHLFNNTKVMVGREELTLDQLEKSNPGHVARFGDPRTHFALVCGALSCPPLLSKAYRGEVLYTQLDKRTALFLNNGEFNTYQPSPSVSALFNWYAADFAGHLRDTSMATRIKTVPGASVNEFIASYVVAEHDRQVVKNSTLTFKTYYWNTNSILMD